MIKNINYTDEEKLIQEAIIEARKIQDYLCKDYYQLKPPFNIEKWRLVFRKRVNKIKNIDSNDPLYLVELKKRILQQAALSILALKLLDKDSKS